MDADARSEAIEAIKQAWDSQPDVNELDLALDPELMLTNAATAALEALTSPRTVECTADGCDNGLVHYGTDEHGGAEPCNVCSGSGRIEKGPIAYLADSLEPAAYRQPTPIYGQPWEYRTFRSLELMRLHADAELLYRLPDESPKGGA